MALFVLPSCGAQPPSGAGVARFERGRSWVSARARSEDLLYVSDQLFTDVYVYSFPALDLVGTLSGFSLPEGLCVDARGDLFVTDLLEQKIFEYAHGGSTRIGTLNDPGYPQGCAVDPSTGNLAVADYGSSGSRGDIAVFRNARGAPKFYRDRTMISFSSCGYDGRGDLFADGQKYGNDPGLVELPKGARALSDVEFGRGFDADGSVEWDGAHLAVMGNSPKRIYRLAIDGYKARVVGRTRLISPRYTFAFWLQDQRLIATYVPAHSRAKDIALGVWAYPAGGKPLKTISPLYGAYGVAISPASRAK